MRRRRLEDRIEFLAAQAIAAKDPDELQVVIRELKAALHEHAARLRKLAAANLMLPEASRNYPAD